MNLVTDDPNGQMEPTARMLCMVLKIAQMHHADGAACLTLAHAMWLERDPNMTPDVARRLFESAGPMIPGAFEMLRRARDAENR
jgi:hypothetical protein